MNVVENKYLENVLNTKQIDTLLSIYNDAGEYQTDAMRKHTGSKNLTSTLGVLAESTKIDIDRIEICHFYCNARQAAGAHTLLEKNVDEKLKSYFATE